MKKISIWLAITLECACLVSIGFCFGIKTFEGIVAFIVVFWIIAVALLILLRRLDKKATFRNLEIESYSDGDKRAREILQNFEWSPVNSKLSNEPRYITFRFNCSNVKDFDWMVKYISVTGKYLNGDKDNPYAEMGIYIGDHLYKCHKSNMHYSVTEIYKI